MMHVVVIAPQKKTNFSKKEEDHLEDVGIDERIFYYSNCLLRNSLKCSSLDISF
jgi:hypothetical protein